MSWYSKAAVCRTALALALCWNVPLLQAADEEPAPFSGAVVLFPGPFGPLVSATSTDPQAEAPGRPAGWHLPGRHLKGGEGWWALVCGDGCRLAPTVLSVQPARHAVYDGDPVPSQLLHWAPLPGKLDQVGEPEQVRPNLVAVFKPTAALAARLKLVAGPVKTWLHSGMGSYPGGGRAGTLEVSIPTGGSELVRVVPRLGVNTPSSDAMPTDPALSFELRVGRQRQNLGSYSFGIEGLAPVPPTEYLRWAGDLDGDGRPDLLMSLGGDSTRVVLWLSSLAKPGELVGEAGRIEYYDPSAAGC